MTTETTATTTADPSQLFEKLEEKFRASGLGEDKWYILATAALAGGNDPELSGPLYSHLTRQPSFSAPEQRQRLVRRLREALVKSVSIVGVCKPLEAIMAINERESEPDKDRSPATRQGWACDEENLRRGMAWLSKVYTGDAGSTLGLFDDHPDFAWISKNITYGLYLSDRQVLDDLETELVVLAGIMIQNLRKETHWHIRGIRRLGVPVEDVRVVWDCVQLVADFLGLKLTRVPSVDDVKDV
ncbi:hypothetical protein N3K66_007670 [Trichothecium roseum]|uniref:Uncharacterized protein n=1 Tax=Trichothecium roseum TaxID=47278 RepID=A0ACC0UUJ2_9HYPO|nr:hypothetical protein N3K66_007670 [Trichothecium roseum]